MIRPAENHQIQKFVEYDFEQGVEKIIELVAGVKEKPAIVGVYGPANSGKTHLRQICANRLYDLGVFVSGGRVEEEESYAPFANSNSLHTVFVDNYIIPFREQSIPFVGKPIDITVVIRNNRHCNQQDFIEIERQISRNSYDVIINNPSSSLKICYSGHPEWNITAELG